MLYSQRVRKHVSLFLMLFLLNVVLLGVFSNVRHLDKHIFKFPIVNTGSVNKGVAFLAADGRKAVFHCMPSQSYDSLTGQICFTLVSEEVSFYRAALTDCREAIRQTVPHYFHGSRYKDNPIL